MSLSWYDGITWPFDTADESLLWGLTDLLLDLSGLCSLDEFGLFGKPSCVVILSLSQSISSYLLYFSLNVVLLVNWGAPMTSYWSCLLKLQVSLQSGNDMHSCPMFVILY